MVTSQHNAGIFLLINYCFNQKKVFQYRRVNGLKREKVGYEGHHIPKNLMIYYAVQNYLAHKCYTIHLHCKCRWCGRI
jgi:hypothetical protein